MPITGKGWEILISRTATQRRSSDGKVRTVGTYQVFHDGAEATGTIAVDGRDVPLFGTTAESPGPSQTDKRADEGFPTRILAKSYEMQTSGGPHYVTSGFRPDLEIKPAMPGVQLRDTGRRTDILIHPGKNEFLSSVGCINPCTALPNADETIDYPGSRRRVIALIEDMRAFLGGLPGPDLPIPNAFVVFDEEALTAAAEPVPAAAAPAVPAAPAPAAPAGGIGWPLKHNVIRGNVANNSFGMVRNGGTKPHQGWDLLAPIGTKCFAIADGKIETIYKSDAYGDVVVLAFLFHNQKRFAAYAHLSAVSVKEGQAITKGQQIGLTGDSGNAHGLPDNQMHLHFEIRTIPRPGLGLGGRVSPIEVFGAIPLHAPIDV
jgi:murein DD-endopeptidase MepM/ murein hydrolase activator NlpD